MEQGPKKPMRDNSWSVSRLHVHHLQGSPSIPHPALFLLFPRSSHEDALISRSGERQEEPRLLPWGGGTWSCWDGLKSGWEHDESVTEPQMVQVRRDLKSSSTSHGQGSLCLSLLLNFNPDC